MGPRKVGVAAFGLALSALLMSGGIAPWTGPSPHAAAAEQNGDKVRLLLQERLAVLKTITDETAEGFRHGTATFGQLAEASRAARSAELDLCDTDQDRVTVLERLLAEAKHHQRDVEAGLQLGRFKNADVLQAKADRMEVEIALGRAQAK